MQIICEISNRHVHLSQEHIEALFGTGYKLTPLRDLSQPGQYLCAERVTLVGPKSTMHNVAIIGPARRQTQVEISRTDTFALGIRDVPVRQSGELHNTPGITIQSGDNQIVVTSGVVVACRHVHLDPKTATNHKLSYGQIISIKFVGERGGMLANTIVRIDPKFAPAVHIDSDEANAMGFTSGAVVIQ